MIHHVTSHHITSHLCRTIHISNIVTVHHHPSLYTVPFSSSSSSSFSTLSMYTILYRAYILYESAAVSVKRKRYCTTRSSAFVSASNQKGFTPIKEDLPTLHTIL
mmetsp:Transcript_38320/g.38675  ORF Transcript_38320/g.38675 Transcript_38320/m.38675 type:complete len:105 (-) Transcript_38320:325-639(-)